MLLFHSTRNSWESQKRHNKASFFSGFSSLVCVGGTKHLLRGAKQTGVK